MNEKIGKRTSSVSDTNVMLEKEATKHDLEKRRQSSTTARDIW